MSPRLLRRSVVAWFPRSEAAASGFDFRACAHLRVRPSASFAFGASAFTVAWVLSTRGCVQRISQRGEQFYLGCVGSLASVGVSATQLHIILDSCRTCELYRGPCLIRWGCRWLVRVRTMRWFGHAAHVPHARLPNDASCVHFKKYLNQVN